MSIPAWLRRLPFPVPLKHTAASAWLMMGRLFAVGAIAAFGLCVYVGASSAIDSILESRDRWYDEGHLADLELHVVADDIRNFPSFEGIGGVAASRIRMVYPGSLESSGGDPLRVLFITAATRSAEPINTRRLLDGLDLDPSDPAGVVVDRNMARYNGVRIGQHLAIKLGKEVIEVHVRGIAADAEFLLAPANPSLFVPSKGSLGVIYANEGKLSSRFGFTIGNSVLFRTQPGADIEAVRERILERAQSRLNVDWTLSRDEQFSYRFLEKNLAAFRIVVPVIVLVSALSALFVVAFLFYQWVAQDRKTIGVFMALGYGGGPISAAYGAMFAYIASAAVLGGLLVAPLVGNRFALDFAGAIGLPAPVLSLTPARVVWGALGTTLVFALAGSLAIARVLAGAPRDAMRRPVLLERGPDRFGSLFGRVMPTAWLRISLRNLLRSRGTSLFTTVSVALGMGITAAFFVSYSSFVGTSIQRVNADRWDLAVDFLSPVWDENLPAILAGAHIRDYAPYTKGVAQAVKGSERVNLYIGGFDPDRDWHVAALTAGRDISVDDPDGLVIEQSTARTLGVGVGDPLRLQMQGRSLQTRVRGLFSGALPGEARLPIAAHRKLADLTERSTGFFVRTAPSDDVPAMVAALRAEADVQQVLTKTQVANEILAASGQITGIIQLGALVSIAIAALLVFACVGYAVLMRRHEYQTLRLIGYSDRTIVATVLAEVVLLGLAAALVAIIVGIVTAQYLNAALSAAWFEVETQMSAGDFLKSFVPALCLLPLVALPIAHLVLREDLAHHLRSREIA